MERVDRDGHGDAEDGPVNVRLAADADAFAAHDRDLGELVHRDDAAALASVEVDLERNELAEQLFDVVMEKDRFDAHVGLVCRRNGSLARQRST